MTEETMRGFTRAFCDALAANEPQRIAPFLDDDVEWTVFGPVDLFPFFGHRRGKAAVLAMCSEIAACLQLRSCEKESTLTDGSKIAALVRVNALYVRSGRIVSLRLAQFADFRDGKLVRLRALFDSFDAAEQALGRQIDLPAA
jgi:ketosteroid isomerase-like protein